LDECVPRPLRRYLTGHDAETVPEMGWSGKKNGELLKLMAQQAFEVFLTVDQNLRFQQNLSGAGVGIIVLVAATNRLADLLPLIPRVLSAMSSIQPGQLIEVGP
ncbi:MAG TPA: hypothetical protein VGX70_04360, partial [Gemmataceae bacterium]|nr:hypothetical protein [Gemmataceae bacterium]